MTAYIIADISVLEPDGYQDYVRQAPDYVARHGGTYLVRGGEMTIAEGDWQPERLVVIRFPSRDDAEALLDDPGYREIAPLRQDNTRSNLLIVDGYDAGA